MRAPWLVVACGVVACTTSCNTPSPSSETVAADRRITLVPYAAGDACVDLVPGDRLDYRWQASEELDFDVRYRSGNATVSPVVLSHARGDRRIFEASLGERYCLHWQAGPAASVVDYRIDIRKPGP